MPRPHSKNLRAGRWSETGQVYLITSRTSHWQPWFADLACGRVVVRSLRWSDENGRSRTWAFVVMPDHLHWLVELRNDPSLAQLVSTVKSYSARAVNERLDRTGSIWQDGFHDHAVRREEDLRKLARYVVMNPVRAGLVGSIREYSLWDARWI